MQFRVLYSNNFSGGGQAGRCPERLHLCGQPTNPPLHPPRHNPPCHAPPPCHRRTHHPGTLSTCILHPFPLFSLPVSLLPLYQSQATWVERPAGVRATVTSFRGSQARMAEPMVILIAQITLRGIKMDTCQRLNPSISRELQHLMLKAKSLFSPLDREKSKEHHLKSSQLYFLVLFFLPVFFTFTKKGWIVRLN